MNFLETFFVVLGGLFAMLVIVALIAWAFKGGTGASSGSCGGKWGSD